MTCCNACKGYAQRNVNMNSFLHHTLHYIRLGMLGSLLGTVTIVDYRVVANLFLNKRFHLNN